MGTIPITGHTGLTCLLGQPVAHSVSPEMHNESFRYHGLDYVYLAFDVAPEQFEAAVDGLITFNARGWNCTMPHKRRMFERVDKLSKEAEPGIVALLVILMLSSVAVLLEDTVNF